MKKNLIYKKRPVCPGCMSLSIKKSYKQYKCDQCNCIFDKPITVELIHKNGRCIDNNIETRKSRLTSDNKILYE